ncbi:hypothetical protein F442_07511 [Phytophthora nicotianae P10297]|uniref:Uncharacterized protein n=2 Tax=Phytophthora nicotianae TaxID=4792 RepID=W2QDM6_PHYN3|nr:hypothetical protein PPTG_10504 [Phytophthora nicotianae INRA-310]ETN10365.1 hypothetical protein PPTG_10504 [Phytophthora nicotianae INRA-310]ETP46201.1 hypothetical protein F442_07511 [Phytophthora nicotianae P10297]
MSLAYASDGGSSTESEDGGIYEANIKSELTVDSSAEIAPASDIVKAEAEVVESPEDDSLLNDEHPIVNASTPATEQQSTEITTPPCCSACGYPLLVVPQAEIMKAANMLDCKCCLLVLPESSYSNTQRGEARKDIRKCKACTGNVVRGAPPLVRPTREKPQIPQKLRSTKTEKRNKEASAVFVNKVGRLKMAKRALLRKRTEAAKLKATKRREEYEQQLDKEEKDLERQSALLKRENPSTFNALMNELKVKKPRTAGVGKKKKKAAPKPRAKRKAETDGEQAKKKKKGPAVDLSVYVPPASSADEVPARRMPTRSRAKTQSQEVAVKAEPDVKTEPKMEIKTE